MGERIRESMVRGAIVWAAVACVLLVWAAGAAAGTVRMKGTTLVEPDRAVTLRDVAEVESSDADLGDVVVVADVKKARGTGQWVVVEVGDVRTALKVAGVSPGRVAVTGGRCVVRFVSPPEPEEKAAAQEREKQTPKVVVKPRPSVVDTSGTPTVRTRVVEGLNRMFGVEEDPTALRLLFDDSDDELLDMEEDGRRVIVRPSSTGSGGRVLVDVQVVEGEQIVESRTVSVDVEVRRRVLIVAQRVERHAVVTPEMVREEEMWVSPRGEAGPGRVEDVVGQLARKPLREGDVLRSEDVEPAVLVERGSTVTVLCLKGGIGIQARGRALGDGHAGEMVECKLLDSRQSFEARVDGPGRVVVVLD